MLAVETNLSLKSLNTFGLDVKAAQYIKLTSVDEAREAICSRSMRKKPLLVLGGGSNLLFTSDFPGTIFHPDIQGIEVAGETRDEIYLRAGAGVCWDDFVAYCVENQWGGLENLSLIPGTVGASPVQNIGAYGVEAKDCIVSVKGLYLERAKPFVLDNESCGFGYRDSVFKRALKGKTLITHVSFRLSKHPLFTTRYGSVAEELKKYDELTLQNIRKAVISIRECKLPNPKVLGNAGSFFKNPTVSESKANKLKALYPTMPSYPTDTRDVKLAAGWLIEQCGWKGKRVGNVGVYEHQALVLVNYGGASAEELTALSASIQASVKEKFEVNIEPEVNFI